MSKALQIVNLITSHLTALEYGICSRPPKTKQDKQYYSEQFDRLQLLLVDLELSIRNTDSKVNNGKTCYNAGEQEGALPRNIAKE